MQPVGEIDASADEAAKRTVVFAGALPPPVTGMTVMTQVIVDALRQTGPLISYNWSRGKPLRGWRWKAARTWGALKSVVGLLTRGSGREASLYYGVSSGSGLYSDMAIVAAARLRGYRVVLHHHTYAYLYRRDWRIAVLDRLIGAEGAHGVHCPPMQQDLLKYYDSKAEFLFVPPTVVAQRLESGTTRSTPTSELVLGMLSNLTFAKGLDDAIATFERLAERGLPVRLILAGPCMGAAERALIDGALARWPDRIEYRGAVYGRDKAQFFSDIDVFVFPTRYIHESWGIVLSEALAVGCPLITRSRGCVPWIVRDGCGFVIDDAQSFPDVAAEHIGRWLAEPDELAQARRAALQRSAALERDAVEQLPVFVEGVRRLR